MPEPIQFTQTSPRFALPFLFAAQTQKEFFVNEAIARVDTLLHTAVEGEEAAPPAAPEEGESWIVADSATGAWAGHEGSLAGWQAGTWQFVEPVGGMQVWDKSEGQFAVYRDGWSRPERPAEPTEGGTVDTELRAAFSDLLEALANAGIIPVT